MSGPASTVPRLAVSGVSKRFGGIRALTDVSFAVAPGSIHALLGENGAGKSTLVKIVTGIQPADTGEIRLDGTAARFRSPLEARAAGVVAVYQDPKLFPHLDVAENIFMGAHPTGALGMITRQAMIERAQRLLDALDSGLDARQSVLGLSIGEAQFIEFARATAAGRMRLLFLDEPTAALTPAETERLFRLVKRLRGEVAIRPFASLMPQLATDGAALTGDLDKFGLGFALNTKPVPTGRGANTLAWAGIFNTFFWIDRENQVSAVLMTQMLPGMDPGPAKLLEDFDRAVYTWTKAR